MTFTDYCAQNNIQLLPDDLTFLRKQLKRIPNNQRKHIVRQYTQQWIEGMQQEPCEYKKQNKGRFKANSWIVYNLM